MLQKFWTSKDMKLLLWESHLTYFYFKRRHFSQNKHLVLNFVSNSTNVPYFWNGLEIGSIYGIENTKKEKEMSDWGQSWHRRNNRYWYRSCFFLDLYMMILNVVWVLGLPTSGVTYILDVQGGYFPITSSCS